MSGLTAAVVIATYNRHEQLETTLSLWDRSIRRPEKLIVVDASEDAPLWRRTAVDRHAELFARGDYIVSDRPSTSAQRNLGIDHVQTDIVFFVDDDCLPSPDLLGRIVEVFEADRSGRIGGVSGWGADWRTVGRRLGWVASAPLRRHVARFALSRDEAMPPQVTVPEDVNRLFPLTRVRELRGCAMAFRTPLVRQLRFDPVMERYAFAEDFDISYRVARTHALVRRDDTVIDYAIAAGSSVPSGQYFLISWVNPAYLIQKLKLGESTLRGLRRRLRLSEIETKAQFVFSTKSWRPGVSERFDLAERMIDFVSEGARDELVERYRVAQSYVFAGTDAAGIESFESWLREHGPRGLPPLPVS